MASSSGSPTRYAPRPTLRAALAAAKSAGSKGVAAEAQASATEGMSAKMKQAYLLKRRADEARLQQLRGIFAAYDEDRDGVLGVGSGGDELANALLALGFEPTHRAIQRYTLASPTGAVDLATVRWLRYRGPGPRAAAPISLPSSVSPCRTSDAQPAPLNPPRSSSACP
jgi:hypothetical protein